MEYITLINSNQIPCPKINEKVRRRLFDPITDPVMDETVSLTTQALACFATPLAFSNQ